MEPAPTILPNARTPASYWLGHCEGFRVETPGGRLGLVEEILHDDGVTPSALVVRGGLLGTRLFLVPLEEVAAVDPRAEVLRLRQTPNVGGFAAAAEEAS